jgi:YNFM family putative membrane transporter
MSSRESQQQFGLLLLVTVLGFWALYTPQPLQPLLHQIFGLPPTTLALLMTATMLPLGIAPIFYGFWLQRLSAKRLLRATTLGLAMTELLIALTNDFSVLLGLRVVQGLLIPGLFTGLMTYISATAAHDELQKRMATYIAITIFGGFFGRFLSGLLGGIGGWHLPFLALGLLLLIAWWALGRLAADPPVEFTRIRWRTMHEILSRRLFLSVYLLVFCCFFVFASLLNFLPYRLKLIDPQISEMGISLYYAGYLIGTLIGANAMRITRLFGNVPRVLTVGATLLLAALPLFLLSDANAIYLVMVLFCAGMFTVHALAPGFLVHQQLEHRGLVNGLYVSFYYTGGALGAWAPGWIYENEGWSTYVVFLMAIMLVAIGLTISLQRNWSRTDM